MAYFQPIIALVSSYIILAFSFVFILTVVYLMFCRSIRIRRRNPDPIIQFSDISPRTSGIDKKIIASLPLCRFSSLQSSITIGVDCAVCLSKFEDIDILHLLPKCSHAFHVSCIDQWLEMHSSCPLCRQRVEAGEIDSFLLPSFSFRNSSRLQESAGVEFPGQEGQPLEVKSSRYSSSATEAECSTSVKKQDEDYTRTLQDAEHGAKFPSQMPCSGNGPLDLMYLNSQMLGSISIGAMGMGR